MAAGRVGVLGALHCWLSYRHHLRWLACGPSIKLHFGESSSADYLHTGPENGVFRVGTPERDSRTLKLWTGGAPLGVQHLQGTQLIGTWCATRRAPAKG